ncbi:MAG: hypothetical protein EON56_04815 [Alphaproteobacteria bacterium]|nr:MAG: hypothetical protein EON56_04815 [Alphaproteobacteria bacterium]
MVIVPKNPGHAERRWLLGSSGIRNFDEEDRAANEWLAGNNAAVKSRGAGLHELMIDAKRGGDQA